ncbi:MAG: YibE/F family protein [Clostridiales bacterium]|nr:YibE/F family protein [Clostridiales bacterium]
MIKLNAVSRNRIIYVCTIIFSILYIFIGNRITSKGLSVFLGGENEAAVTARVVSVSEKKETEYRLSDTETHSGWELYFEAEITSGELKKSPVSAVQVSDPFHDTNVREVSPGDKILLIGTEEMEYPVPWLFLDYERFNSIIWLAVVFLLGLLIFGGVKGLNTIISLGFTCLSIFLVFIPAVLTGRNIYFWSITTCVYITLMTLLIVSGANRKSLAACIGCFSGTLAASLTMLISDRFIKLTGMLNDESLYLMLMNPDKPIDLKAIIFASIIIGAIGAIMDVSISISSSLIEVRDTAKSIRASSLFRSGLRIGRDIMGTMSNTLILAYIGSSLALVLLLVSYQASLRELLNRELIIVEILQALAGSLGILLTIPLNSAVCAILYTRTRQPKKHVAEEPENGEE